MERALCNPAEASRDCWQETYHRGWWMVLQLLGRQVCLTCSPPPSKHVGARCVARCEPLW